MEPELVETQEDNNKIYIQMSKTNIDDYIYKNDYRKAFTLLLMVIERLDNNTKVEFIDYYSKKLFNPISISHLDDRRFDCKFGVCQKALTKK